MSNNNGWISVEDKLPEDGDEAVLVFAPEYPRNSGMNIRIITGQFVSMCSDVTHWQ